jgi:hypothetical protein
MLAKASEPSAISGQIINVKDVNANLQRVISQIDLLITEQHAANIMAMWRIGGLINEIENNAEKYLTEEQQSQHVNPSMLLVQAFNGSYTPDHFDKARNLFESYSEPAAIEALVNLRCPARPNWRLTASHVQMLLTVADPDQRKVLEERCANEAYTTKALAVELSELTGKDKKKERSPTTPKGLKQKVYDLLEHQRKFITRSEKLWVEDDGLYDILMNSPASKLTDTLRGYFTEIVENFEKMHELVQIHQQMCQKVAEMMDKHADVESTAEDVDDSDASGNEDTDADNLWHTKPKGKGITR